MKLITKIVVIFLIVALGVFFALYFVYKRPNGGDGTTPGATAGQTTAGGPGSWQTTGMSTGTTGAMGTSTDGKRVVAGAGGGQVLVKDFLVGKTPEQSKAVGTYYHLREIATNTPFQVIFTERDSFFQVALTASPLGIVRKDAEAFLLNELGIDEPTACTLKYSVNTTYDQSELYSGRNLKFSFCPDAVGLPEI